MTIYLSSEFGHPPWMSNARARVEPRPTRERILVAAERLFAERGFANVSMPELAKASSITAGAIYKHFESKEALFFEVVGAAVAQIALPPSDSSTVDALAHAARTYTEERLALLRRLAVEVHVT